MKLEIPKFKKSFKKESFSVNPNTYFRYVIIISFAVILVGFGFGFYSFKEFGSDSSSTTNNYEKTIELSKKEKIKKVLEYFSERENKSIEIVNSPAPVTDPSL